MILFFFTVNHKTSHNFHKYNKLASFLAITVDLLSLSLSLSLHLSTSCFIFLLDTHRAELDSELRETSAYQRSFCCHYSFLGALSSR